MAYVIIFESGSLAGLHWRIPDGGMLTIGRSHSCTIRPKEPDVSGKHVVIREEGGVVWLEVLSKHKTAVDGENLPVGGKVAITEVSQVALGGSLAFRLGKLTGDGNETGEIPPSETDMFGGTGSLGTGAVATAATRAANTATIAAANTATLGDETGSLSGAVATAATRAAGTGTLATAATRAADIHADSETSILPSGETPGAKGGTAGETTDLGSDGGETQMLHTQMASREELEKIKIAYEQKLKARVAKRFCLLGFVAAMAVGVSIWFSTRKPENPLSMPKERESARILPDLAPAGTRGAVDGEIGLSYPSVGARIKKSENTIEVRTFVGRKLDVEVVVAVDVFEDESAIGESRNATFMRYILKSPDLVKILDNMYPLPDEDFFGGMGGRLRGIPCSRVEYWRMRGRENVYGVVSFFRSGPLCCALRREVPAAEKDRAAWLLLDTRTWLFADDDGKFAATQWEGAEDAGCADTALEISRCEARFAVDSPAEWPEIERGLRDILVETWGDDAYADVRSRALKLLADLRARKATNWKRLAAGRVPISLPGDGTSDKFRASELDEAARKDYPSPDEEWYFLARRRRWWE